VPKRLQAWIRVIASPEDLQELVPSWWGLLRRAVHPQPTQTPLWLLSWWKVYGSSGGRELRVVVVSDLSGGEVVGIIPLLRRWVRRAGVVPVATLELLGSGEPIEDEVCSEYIGAIVARGYEQAVAAAFARVVRDGHCGAWDELRMPSMSSDDPTLPRLVAELRSLAVQVELQTKYECPSVELPATWDKYLAGLEGSRRYFVQRTLRDFHGWAGPGGAVLCRVTSEAELARGTAILRALHAERWSDGGAFQSPRFQQFHHLVMPALLRGEGGTLDLLWLEVGGAPVAALYNLVYQGNVLAYQAGRKLDVPKHVRPGIAIHLLAMQRAIEMGHHTYDFLASADQYKRKLAPGPSRHLVTLVAIAPTVRAHASSEARRTFHQLASAARSIASRFSPRARPPTPAAPPSTTTAANFVCCASRTAARPQ